VPVTSLISDHLLEDLDRPQVHFLFVAVDVLLQLLLLLFRHVHPAAEPLGADDHAFLARRHLQRVVLHVLARPAEDRVQQLFFRRQLALGLGRDLAHEDVAGADAGSHAHDAVLV